MRSKLRFALVSGFAISCAIVSGALASGVSPGCPPIGAVCAAGNTVNSVSASKGIQWTTGGTYTAAAPEVVGPTDQTLHIVSGSGSSGNAGQILILGAGGGNGGAAENTELTLAGDNSAGDSQGFSLISGTAVSANGNGSTSIVRLGRSNGSGTPGQLQFQAATPSQSSGTIVTTLQSNQGNTSGTSNYLWNVNPTFLDNGVSSSGSPQGAAFVVAPTLNYTGSTKAEAFTALLVNQTNTSAPTGTLLLQDWQLGGASKARVDTSGNVGLLGGLSVGGEGTTSTAGQIAWPTGLGAITHVLGPTDQSFKIGSQSSQNLVLNAASGALIALQINGSNAWQVASTNALNGTSSASKIGQYASVNTAGWGVPAIYSSGRNAAVNAAASTPINAFSVPALDSSYELTANVLITTLGSGSFTVTCTYTDEGNTSRTLTLPFYPTSGTATTTINAAGPWSSPTVRIRCKASTTISVQSVAGTFTGCTYNIEASLMQIS
jgi:hypothetical protein